MTKCPQCQGDGNVTHALGEGVCSVCKGTGYTEDAARATPADHDHQWRIKQNWGEGNAPWECAVCGKTEANAAHATPADHSEPMAIYQAKIMVDPKWSDVSKAEFDKYKSMDGFDTRIVYAQAPQPEAQSVRDADPIRALIAAHTDLLEQNPYAYFELAYTRYTGWMAWLCSNSRDDDPNRKILAKGQGESPEAACTDALKSAPPQKPVSEDL